VWKCWIYNTGGKMKEAKEEKQINIPVSKFFKKKFQCDLSRVEFTFAAGELDVLGYNRKQKCFYVSEGKRSGNISSLGHAVGQLIAYISMIQENGYDFLNRVSKGEHLQLSDFSTFLEKKQIKVCFYIGLPSKNKEKLLTAAELVLKNLGDFGSKIGIIFASTNKCELAKEALPMAIEISKNYSKEEYIDEVLREVEEFCQSRGIIHSKFDNRFPLVLQFMRKDGNHNLHYEIWIKQQKKTAKNLVIEVGFHVEFAKAHLERKTAIHRKKKIEKVLRKSGKMLENEGFVFQGNWGQRWSRLFYIHESESLRLNDSDKLIVIEKFKKLVDSTKPMLDKINWGRITNSTESTTDDN